MSELERSVRRFRASLLKQDAQSRNAVQRSYNVALKALQAELKATLARIDAIRAEDGTVPLWRLIEEQRLRQLIARAEIEFARHAKTVEAETIRAQQQAVERAQRDAVRLIEAGFGPGPSGAVLPVYTLPTEAITQLTAALQPDAPVRQLIDSFAGDAAQAVQDELLGGAARGAGADEITRAIMDALDGTQRARAERIVRTELMRAYRGASLETMKQNAHLMRGWRWFSAMDRRTCPVCIAMHGRLFKIDQPFSSHPNCRCVPMPETKSWKDLGYDVPDNRPKIVTGPEVFAGWSGADQRNTLGLAAYAAFKAGDVGLSDFVGITRSTVWGTGRRRVSLVRAMEKGRKAA